MNRVPQEEIPFVNTKSNTFIRRSINDKVLAVSQLGKNPWKIIIILFHLCILGEANSFGFWLDDFNHQSSTFDNELFEKPYFALQTLEACIT